MHFRIGEIPPSLDFVADESWQPLREPTPWVAQIMAAPVAIAASTLVGVLWFALAPVTVHEFPGPLWLLVTIVVVIVLHEFIHAAFHPGFGASNRTVLGVWPAKLLFFAHYLGPMTRNRFLAILFAPFLIISFGPMVVACLFGVSNPLLAFASIFNALAACVDLLGVTIVLLQVPAKATVQNQGWRTFWQLPINEEPL